MTEGNTAGSAIASILRTLRSQRPLACMETPRARTGRPRQRPSQNRGGPVGEGHEPEGQHARRRGGGRLHITDEVSEQRWANTGGGCGGKATDQGERWAGDRAPDSEPDQRVERLARCA